MNKSTRIFTALGLSLCVASGTMAQSSGTAAPANNNKLFTEWGICPFLGYSSTPLSSYTTYYSYNNGLGNYIATPYTGQARMSSYEYISFLFRARMNLKEFTNNSSLSVSVMPVVGISGVTTVYETSTAPSGAVGDGSSFGLFTLDIPLLLEYNIGNVATYSADADKGVVLGLGIEYVGTPLYGGGASINDQTDEPATAKLTSSWVEPCLEVGYRHWNKSNKAKEFNLKVGFGTGGSFSARLSWMKCIGY